MRRAETAVPLCAVALVVASAHAQPGPVSFTTQVQVEQTVEEVRRPPIPLAFLGYHVEWDCGGRICCIGDTCEKFVDVDISVSGDLLACYVLGDMIRDILLGGAFRDFACPVNMDFIVLSEKVTPNGDRCGSVSLSSVSGSSRRATLRITNTEDNDCNDFYEAEILFSIPVWSIQQVHLQASEQPASHTLLYSDIYVNATSPLPLRWLRETTARVPACTEPCEPFGAPHYGVTVTGISPPDERVVAAMLSRKFCDAGLSPPAAPDCAQAGEVATVTNGPQLNATLPKSGVVIPPIFSELSPVIANTGKFNIRESPGGGDTSPDEPLLVVLAGKPFTIDLYPVSFADGTMSVVVRDCNLGTIQDVNMDLLANALAQGAVDPSQLCPVELYQATLPTAVQKHSIQVQIDEVGVHFLQLSVTDAFGAVQKGRLVVVRHTPVVYAHGFGTTAHVWRPLARFLYDNDYLVDTEGTIGQSEAQDPFFSAYGDPHRAFGLATPGSVWGYAADVSSTVYAVRHKTGLQRVDLVGHSMGGLVGRSYDNFYYPSYVRKIATAGTPMHGSDMATLVLAVPLMGATALTSAGIATGGTLGLVLAISGIGGGAGLGASFSLLGGQSVYDMVPHSAFLTELNNNDGDTGSSDDIMPNQNYLTIGATGGGTISHTHDTLTVILANIIYAPLLAAQWWSAIEGAFVAPTLDQGDVVVTHKSARIDGIPLVTFLKSEVECEGGVFDLFHSCFFQKAPVSTAIQSFFNEAPGILPAAPESAAGLAAAQNGSFRDSRIELLLFSPSEELPKTITRAVPVDSTVSNLGVEVYGHGAVFNVKLVDPEGNALSPEATHSDENLTAFLFSESTMGRAGSWQLTVDVTNPSVDSPALLLTHQIATSSHLVVALSDRFIKPSDALSILLLARNGNELAPLMRAHASIITPAGRTVVVELSDDGVRGDITAADGAFMATFTDTEEIGTYHAEITGQILVGPFVAERVARTEFEVIQTRNLRVVPNSIRLDPSAPVAGQCVQMLAEIENIGEAPAREVRVVLLQTQAGLDPEPVDAAVVSVGPQGRAPISLVWQAVTHVSQLELAIQPAPTFRENELVTRERGDNTVRAAYGDNVTRVPVSVAPAVGPPTLQGVTPTQQAAELPFVLYAIGSAVDDGWDIFWTVQLPFGGSAFNFFGARAFSSSGLPRLTGPGGAGISYPVTVTLTARSPDDQAVSDTTTMLVVPSPEAASLTGPAAPHAPIAAIAASSVAFALEPIVLSGAGSLDNYGVVSYDWRFAPSATGVVSATGPRVVLPRGFAKAGDIQVQLAVNDLASMGNFGGSVANHNISISKRPTAITIASDPDPLYFLSEPATVAVRLADVTPGTCGGALSGFPVDVSLAYADGQVQVEQAATAAGGVAEISFVPRVAGNLVIAASYAGDLTYAPSSAPSVLNAFVGDVQAPRVAVTGVEDGRNYGQPVTIRFAAVDADPEGVAATLDGSPIESGTTVSAYGEHTLVVVATDTAGNVSETRLTFRLLLVPSPITFTLCAQESLTLANQGLIQGRDRVSGLLGSFGHVGSAGDLFMQNAAAVEGDVVVGRDLIMENAAHVSGTAYVGGSSTLRNTASVSGGIQHAEWSNGLCTCGFDLDAAMAGAVLVNDNHLLMEDSDIARWLVGDALTLSGASVHVVLPAGTFLLSGLSLSNQATLSVAPGARVVMLVRGPVEVRNNARLNIPLSQAAKVWIITDDSGQIEIENSTENGLSLFAPHADVRVVNYAQLIGSITGRSIHAENHGVVLRDVSENDVRRLLRQCPSP